MEASSIGICRIFFICIEFKIISNGLLRISNGLVIIAYVRKLYKQAFNKSNVYLAKEMQDWLKLAYKFMTWTLKKCRRDRTTMWELKAKVAKGVASGVA